MSYSRLRLGAAVIDHDGSHGGQALVIDHVVEDGRQVIAHAIGVGGNDHRKFGARDIPRRNIDADVTLKRAVNTRVELAFGGVHYELDHLAFGNAGPLSEFGRGGIGRPIGIVAIGEVLSPCGKVLSLAISATSAADCGAGASTGRRRPGPVLDWRRLQGAGAGGGIQGTDGIWAKADGMRSRDMIKNFIVFRSASRLQQLYSNSRPRKSGRAANDYSMQIRRGTSPPAAQREA